MDIAQRLVAKITDNHAIPIALRSNLIFINKMGMTSLPVGFKAYLVFDDESVESLETDLDNVFSITRFRSFLVLDM